MKNLVYNRIAIGVLLIVLTACSREEKSQTDGAATAESANTVTLTEEQKRTVGIEMGKVEERVLSGTLTLTGMLDVPPQNLVNVTAPFGGFLRSTSLLQGMHIKKGAVIATIENPEYIQLQQDFLDTKSQSEFLESEYQRQQELAKESINAQKTLQKAAADLNSV
ncbi:MAG TPA: hypothetical protein VG737_15660, partial [Cyclobacteriaceae bacterium]|nr:hypothetical protein [Cyclobacteriaceae bacterium]